MEFAVHQFPHIKLALHVAQLAFIAVSWCLDIAVFRSSASADGRLGWAFAMVSGFPSQPRDLTFQLTGDPVLPHHPSDHLRDHDPPLPPNPKIRQPLRFRRRRCQLLHPLAVRLRCRGELEWDGEV